MKHDNGFGRMLLFHSCRTDLCNTKEVIDKFERDFYHIPEVTNAATTTTTTSTTSSTTTSTFTTTSTSPPMTTTTTSTTQSSTVSTAEKILPTEALVRGSATTCASKFAILTLVFSFFVRY
uniref:ZP domain-containing protein n=1 Tax=Panagrellus redivivus TaxID=6233 RepID=A0A7E4V5T5_PANRE